jgi:hypothetical protein
MMYRTSIVYLMKSCLARADTNTYEGRRQFGEASRNNFSDSKCSGFCRGAAMDTGPAQW